MSLTIGLAGDTMLGRAVADQVLRNGTRSLFTDEVRDFVAGTDLFLLNLECCVSARGRRASMPGKPFFFRAPPGAVEALARLGTAGVTLANNHALDYGPEALLDTVDHLAAAGIATVGAGGDLASARTPAFFSAGGARVAYVGVTDHPAEFAAAPDRTGVAFADLWTAVPGWLTALVSDLRRQADVVLVSPHWGPNMVAAPVPHVRRAAAALVEAGASLVAGHSAHVFHGIAGPVLYDLGDFVDDYAVDADLRNDLGLLFAVTLDAGGPTHVEALPLALDFCHTRLAEKEEYAWVRDRFTAACAELGTEVVDAGDRLTVRYP